MRFFLARAAQVDGRDPLRDVLLGLVAATEEPIAGGRHKVFGRHDLHIIPQTSTIASHLPRAVGVAFSIARAKKLGVTCPWPDDALTVCSFGDASVNHSTAVGAINTALHSAYQGCADAVVVRLRGQRDRHQRQDTPRLDRADLRKPRRPARISTPTDPTWRRRSTPQPRRPTWVRTHRRPAFLHLRMVRLMGHAGSDFEPAYRRPDEIAADYDRDPVLCTAKLLIEQGVLTPAEVLDRYEAKRANVIELAERGQRAGAARQCSRQ